MACISRRPRCGTADSPVDLEPLSDIGAVIGTISGLIGALGIFGQIAVEGGIISIGGVAIGGAAAGGVIAAALVVIAIIVVVGLYALDRCVAGDGLRECIAGVVHEIVESFSGTLDNIFPFTAMHDRIDVVVKSRYWDVVEHGNANVYCTDAITPQRSEIMRCYYFDDQVCNAAQAGIYGATIGGVAGIIAAAIATAAIGCATVILCILALIVAVLIAAVAALVGALAAGQIARATTDESSPIADSGIAISVGDLVSVTGNMVRREYDDKANVMWFEEQTNLHGSVSDGLTRPFTYCEIDEELTSDSCPSPLI